MLPHIRSLDLGVPLEVDDHVPENLTAPLSKPSIFVRDDGATPTSQVTFQWSGGITVYANTREDAKAIAHRLYGHLTDDALAALPGSPVAAVDRDAFLGPYAVPDAQPMAVWYFTVGYLAVGHW